MAVYGQEEEDENAEVDNENQEGKLAWAGGRKEEATYEAGDAEDKAVAAAAQQAAQKEALGPEVSSRCSLDSLHTGHRSPVLTQTAPQSSM